VLVLSVKELEGGAHIVVLGARRRIIQGEVEMWDSNNLIMADIRKALFFYREGGGILLFNCISPQ